MMTIPDSYKGPPSPSDFEAYDVTWIEITDRIWTPLESGELNGTIEEMMRLMDEKKLPHAVKLLHVGNGQFGGLFSKKNGEIIQNWLKEKNAMQFGCYSSG